MRIRLRNVDVHHGHVLRGDVALQDRRCGDHIDPRHRRLLPTLKIVELLAAVRASKNVAYLLDIRQVLA